MTSSCPVVSLLRENKKVCNHTMNQEVLYASFFYAYRVIYFINENLNEKCPSFEHYRNLLWKKLHFTKEKNWLKNKHKFSYQQITPLSSCSAGYFSRLSPACHASYRLSSSQWFVNYYNNAVINTYTCKYSRYSGNSTMLSGEWWQDRISFQFRAAFFLTAKEK